jgi:hypothetical protein
MSDAPRLLKGRQHPARRQLTAASTTQPASTATASPKNATFPSSRLILLEIGSVLSQQTAAGCALEQNRFRLKRFVL